MKTKNLLESVGIKFNSNGFCVVTHTDVNRALKAYSAKQIKEIDRLTEELGYERSIQKEEYQIKINELREALSQAHQALYDLREHCQDRGYIDFNDEGNQGAEEVNSALARCRKLIGD